MRPRRRRSSSPAATRRSRASSRPRARCRCDVVSNPAAPLGAYDLAVLVVESVEPPLRAAVTRVLTDDVPYVVLVRRDVWSAASSAVHKLLDEVQRDPRRKLIRFWRDRDDLERTLREEVFTLDDATLVSQTLRDGAFVEGRLDASSRRGSSRTPASASGRGASLKELASEHLDARAAASCRSRARSRASASRSPSASRRRTSRCSCRSVWQMVDADGRLVFPWAPGMRCQVLAVYCGLRARDRAGPGSGPRPRAARAPRRASGPRAGRRRPRSRGRCRRAACPAPRTASASRRSASLIAAWSPASTARADLVVELVQPRLRARRRPATAPRPSGGRSRLELLLLLTRLERAAPPGRARP